MIVAAGAVDRGAEEGGNGRRHHVVAVEVMADLRSIESSRMSRSELSSHGPAARKPIATMPAGRRETARRRRAAPRRSGRTACRH